MIEGLAGLRLKRCSWGNNGGLVPAGNALCAACDQGPIEAASSDEHVPAQQACRSAWVGGRRHPTPPVAGGDGGDPGCPPGQLLQRRSSLQPASYCRSMGAKDAWAGGAPGKAGAPCPCKDARGRRKQRRWCAAGCERAAVQHMCRHSLSDQKQQSCTSRPSPPHLPGSLPSQAQRRQRRRRRLMKLRPNPAAGRDPNIDILLRGLAAFIAFSAALQLSRRHGCEPGAGRCLVGACQPNQRTSQTAPSRAARCS